MLFRSPGTVDATNPKCVRASAGSLFRLPLVRAADLDTVKDAGLRLLGTSSHRGSSYETFDLRSRVAIVVGHEAHGMAEDARVDDWITIPHAGRAESLNVAMAGTVLCFEVARQRRGHSGTVSPGHED